MSVSNLTNTVWVSKSTYTTSTFYHFDITGYYGISSEYGKDVNNSMEGGLVLNGFYKGSGDYNQTMSNTFGFGNRMYATSPYKWCVYVTGGADVTNATLISLLEANATQVTTLSDTTWLFDEYVGVNIGDTYYINFTSNNNTYTSISTILGADEPFLAYNSTKVCGEVAGWKNDAYRTIHITGGSSATNGHLIGYVVMYATQASSGHTITIDGTGYSVDDGDSLLVNASGLYNSTTSTQLFTYASTGRFLGFNTSSGQTTPSSNYEINDTFTASADLTLYSVAQQPTAVFDLDTLGLSAGTYTITAKAEGSGFQDSVASNAISFTVAPSGFTVSGTLMVPSFAENTCYQYSIDGGTTWNNFQLLSELDATIVPIIATQIQFRVRKLFDMEFSAIVSDTLGCDIRSSGPPYVYSSNYTLSQNVNDVVLGGRF